MKYKIIAVFLLSISVGSHSKAANITLYNDEDFDFYAAIYYVTKTSFERATDPALVNSGQEIQIERPAQKRSQLITFIDRNLVIAQNKADLKPVLSVQEYSDLISKNIGSLKGNTFFIATQDGKTKLFNYAQYKIINPFLAVITTTRDLVKNITKRDLPQIRLNPYKDTVTSVRQGRELNKDETNYLSLRLQKVKVALQKILDKKLGNYVPRISLVASGGGYRATVATLGWLAGAEKIDLLDAVTWVVGLSGSTWAIGSWIQSGTTAEQHRMNLIKAMSSETGSVPGLKNVKGLSAASNQEANLIAEALATKWIYNQPITIVDIYGSLLANRLFKQAGDKRHMQYLSQQADILKNGNLPLPIYTAVQIDKKNNRSLWYEFTPFEVGSLDLQMHIPSWSYGNNFNAGKNIDNPPQQSLGVLFGTFGSAFAATVQRIFEEIASKFTGDYKKLIPVFETLIKTSLHEKKYNQYATLQFPLTYAKVRNPFETIPTTENIFSGDEFIELVDAGIAFNLPYPPVSGQNARHSDILIFLDASDPLNNAGSLKKAQQYATARNIPFPPINYTNIDNKIMSVFKDETNHLAPVVIYMPLVQDTEFIAQNIDNPEFAILWKKADGTIDLNLKNKFKNFDLARCLNAMCQTANFTYPEQEARMLSLLTEFNMIASKEQVFEAIEWRINHP